MLMIPPALATKSGAQRMPARGEQLGDGVVGELVVRRAGDRAAAQARDGLVVEHAAERARGEHVDVGRQRRAGSAQSRAELVGERALALVDVGDDELRAAARRAAARERAADAAEADHGDRAALEVDAVPNDALAG